MWSIIVRDREGRLQSTTSLEGAPVTIGRDPDRGIVLASSSVSRRHARLELSGGEPTLVDEGSANGSSVDGRRIDGPTRLGEASRIEIGGFVLTLARAGSAAAVDAVALAAAVVVKPPAGGAPAAAVITGPSAGGSGPGAPRASAPGAAQPPLPALGLRLLALGGIFDGQTFPLRSGTLSVGRGDGNDVVLEHASISRRHARLAVAADAQSIEVQDLGSANGSFVNGVRIEKGAVARVGDRVRLGEVVFRLQRAEVAAVELAPPARRRVPPVMVAAGLAVVSVGIAVVLAWQRPGGDGTARLALERRFAQEAARIDDGREELRLQRWREAEMKFEEALRLDPLNEEAGQLRDQARREAKARDDYELAGRLGSRGDAESLWHAFELLEAVPADSHYRSDARRQLEQVRSRVADAVYSAGSTRCRVRDDVGCQRGMCRFLLAGVDALMPDKAALARRTLTEVEGRLGRRPGFAACTVTVPR